MDTLEEKQAVVAEAQKFLDETATHDRMTVIVSVRDDMLSVSILNASAIQAVLMLRQAYRDALEKANDLLDSIEQASGKERH